MTTAAIAVSLTLFSYTNVSVTEMRKEANNKSEIVSQTYFSEPIRILEEAGEWVKIETVVDKYQGWVEKRVICQRNDEFLTDPSTVVARVNRMVAPLYDKEDTVDGPLVILPFESRLEVREQKEPNSRWIKVSLPDGRVGFIQRGAVTLKQPILNRNEMCEFSLKFAHADIPYFWGGRSSFGYDCSGFVQMLYRQMGVFLPRDTQDQVKWEGFRSIAISELQPGDLIFFGQTEDKIRHVGMYLGNDTFVHATVAENNPYIHTSKLTDPAWNGTGRYKYPAARTLRQ